MRTTAEIEIRDTARFTGQTLHGVYRLVSLIATDFAGTLYRAVEQPGGGSVGIKLLPHGFFFPSDAILDVDHPNICRIHKRLDPHEGLTPLVVDLPDGKPARSLISRHRRVPPGLAVTAVMQVLSALHVLHFKEITVGNLNLESLYFGRDPLGDLAVRLMNLGVADSRKVPDEPFYLAPEVLLGGIEPDRRADIWSVGVVLFEMLFGRRPFGGRDRDEIAGNVLLTELALPAESRDLPGDLVEILKKALEKDPEARYQNVTTMTGDLLPVQEALDDSTGEAAIDAFLDPSTKSRAKTLPSVSGSGVGGGIQPRKPTRPGKLPALGPRDASFQKKTTPHLTVPEGLAERSRPAETAASGPKAAERPAPEFGKKEGVDKPAALRPSVLSRLAESRGKKPPPVTLPVVPLPPPVPAAPRVAEERTPGASPDRVPDPPSAPDLVKGEPASPFDMPQPEAESVEEEIALPFEASEPAPVEVELAVPPSVPPPEPDDQVLDGRPSEVDFSDIRISEPEPMALPAPESESLAPEVPKLSRSLGALAWISSHRKAASAAGGVFAVLGVSLLVLSLSGGTDDAPSTGRADRIAKPEAEPAAPISTEGPTRTAAPDPEPARAATGQAAAAEVAKPDAPAPASDRPFTPPAPAEGEERRAAPPAEPETVTITFAGLLPGARISVDRREVTSPVELPFGTGAVSLAVHLDGYWTFSKQIVPDRDQTVEVVLNEKAEATSTPRRSGKRPKREDPSPSKPSYGHLASNPFGE